MEQKTEASQAVDELIADFTKALQLADKVGRSRQANCYALNSTAVDALVTLQMSIEDRIRAALKAQPAPAEAQGDLRERMIAAMEAERVEDTGTDGDIAYNNAIGHCIDAVNGLFTPAQIAVQDEGSARLDAADLATIEEGTKVLESAAKHNEGLGRTVFAHAQRDRAVRLRAILDRARASAETGGVKS